MRHRLCAFACLIMLGAAACGSDPAIPPTDSFGSNSAIFWDRNPDTIVFRAEVIGGGREAEFAARNDIAPCTVYGDNRVVWTNDLGPNNQQVLYDQVADDAIRYFVEMLTVVDQLFNYPAGASLQLPGAALPVYEQIAINVSGRTFSSDSFAGWPADYFPRILERCRAISQAPVLFEPTAGWLSAEAVIFDVEQPTYPWDAQAARLSLVEIANSGERRWINDSNVRILWNLIRTSPPRFQLIENNQAYRIALEVPRTTRYAPAAPG
jgi:hypothetical protein